MIRDNFLKNAADIVGDVAIDHFDIFNTFFEEFVPNNDKNLFYEVSDNIIYKTNNNETKDIIYMNFYLQFLLPVVLHVMKEDYESAIIRYAEEIEKLENNYLNSETKEIKK